MIDRQGIYRISTKDDKQRVINVYKLQRTGLLLWIDDNDAGWVDDLDLLNAERLGDIEQPFQWGE